VKTEKSMPLTKYFAHSKVNTRGEMDLRAKKGVARRRRRLLLLNLEEARTTNHQFM